VVARSSFVDGLQNQSDGVSLLKAIVLTREHKAIYPQERTRIQKVRTACTQIDTGFSEVNSSTYKFSKVATITKTGAKAFASFCREIVKYF
jgi:hypothetical protein